MKTPKTKALDELIVLAVQEDQLASELRDTRDAISVLEQNLEEMVDEPDQFIFPTEDGEFELVIDPDNGDPSTYIIERNELERLLKDCIIAFHGGDPADGCEVVTYPLVIEEDDEDE